jgi:hypothetical protein
VQLSLTQQIANVIQFHRDAHRQHVECTEVNLGVDGVAEANSNKVSLNVFALMFPGCRNVYCVCIQRPKRGQDKEAAQRYTRELIDDLKYVYNAHLMDM